MSNLKTDAIIKGFLEYLKKENALSQLPEIARKLTAVVDEVTTTATVFSSLPLTKTQSSQITKILDTNFDIKKVAFEKDSELLGGIKVKIGDRVIDLSLKNKLNSLSKSI